MTTEQLETVLTTTAVQVNSTVSPPVSTEVAETTTVDTGPKRSYTKKEDMANGNNAILATLPTEGVGLGKAQILAALSPENLALVERNWNLRISYLEESGQVTASGNKVAKKYLRTATQQ